MSWTIRLLPAAALFVAGLVLVAIGGDAPVGAGIVLLGSGILVAVFAGLNRIAVSSQDDREAEERARETYARTGRWPRD